MHTPFTRTTLVLATCLVFAACAGRVGTPIAQECAESVRLADKELEDAKVKGFSGSIEWIKGANLLAAAKIQQQLERYESCVDKVRRARIYIKESQK